MRDHDPRARGRPGAFAGTARQENLEHLSPAAGRALLRIGGVQGTDAELEATSAAFGNHALAVTLLASYLQALPGHPASRAGRSPTWTCRRSGASTRGG